MIAALFDVIAQMLVRQHSQAAGASGSRFRWDLAATVSTTPGSRASREPEERPHPPPLLADQDLSPHRRVRLQRSVLQPPPTPLHARHALPSSLRTRHSERHREQPRRSAARTHQQDQLQITGSGPSRLTTACPPNRGRSRLPHLPMRSHARRVHATAQARLRRPQRPTRPSAAQRGCSSVAAALL